MAPRMPPDLELRWKLRVLMGKTALFIHRRTHSIREFLRWYVIRGWRGKSRDVYFRWLGIKTATAERRIKEYRQQTNQHLQEMADTLGITVSELKQYLDNL